LPIAESTLVKERTAWVLRYTAGKEEILFGGSEEMRCHYKVAEWSLAKKEYYGKTNDESRSTICAEVVSDQGKHNGPLLDCRQA